jgi:hypothetical protein
MTPPSPPKKKENPKLNPLSFRCPTCNARVRERCATTDGQLHKRRVRLAAPPEKKGKRESRSVWAVPTAFETNWQKH